MKRGLNYLFKLNSLKLGIILTIIMVILIRYRPMFLEGLEAKAYDLRLGDKNLQPEKWFWCY